MVEHRSALLCAIVRRDKFHHEIRMIPLRFVRVYSSFAPKTNVDLSEDLSEFFILVYRVICNYK